MFFSRILLRVPQNSSFVRTSAETVFETWRRLLQKFSMPNAQREHALLAQVLDWKFNAHSFEQDFNAWETVKVRYETLTGTSLPYGVLIATLLNKTSGPLQQHLRLNSTSNQDLPANA